MGGYDFLKGPCPDCGEEIGQDSGDIQVKWFVGLLDGECFRTYRPGDPLPNPNFLPTALPDGVYLTYENGWACRCGSREPLFAVLKDGRFEGFTRKPAGVTHDVNFARHGIQRA